MGAAVEGRRRALRPGTLSPEGTVVRVLPDAGALDKRFDYLVPPGLPGGTALSVGAEVRVDLHGRRIGGWVVAVGVDPPPGVELRPLSRVRGHGPSPDVVDLAGWAAWRWAGRTPALLTTASPGRAVPTLPPSRLRPPAAPAATPVPLPAGAGTVLARLGPATDLTPLVAALAQRGPTLVVVPALARAAALAARIRRAGGDVALLPGDWAQARAGAAVVVGARAAAWAPCPGMAAAVVVDAHDEALVQEQAPTWSAAEVVAERARRAGVPCVLTSPWPTATLAAVAPEVITDEAANEAEAWARCDVVDMRAVDPHAGLWSPAVAEVVREGRVVVVLNRTGRARLLVCAACGTVARCERCDAAVAAVEGDGADIGAGREVLRCPRCALERPVVCASCTSTALRHLRVGVSRAREQLEVLARRPVGEVTAATAELPPTPVLVGTAAVLHRAEGADVVVFADLDSSLLAPRYRAAEEVGAMLCLASRLVGGRRRPGGRIVLQTRVPDHPVVVAAVTGHPGGLALAELAVRSELGLPPAAALAALSGAGAEGYASAVAARGQAIEVLGGPGRVVLRAATSAVLADALAATPRPAGRLRVEVDPLTL